jgi:hypothetical protein
MVALACTVGGGVGVGVEVKVCVRVGGCGVREGMRLVSSLGGRRPVDVGQPNILKQLFNPRYDFAHTLVRCSGNHVGKHRVPLEDVASDTLMGLPLADIAAFGFS